MGSQARVARERRGRTRRGARNGETALSRERIVAAGLKLLRARGPGELSIRALADALGTAPMSLYRHVRSKDELLSAIIAAVLEQLTFDVPVDSPWTDQVSAWMHSLRNHLLQAPAAVAVLVDRGHYAPALLRATNTLLRILRQAGFAGSDAVRASREIMWSTLGFVSAEIRGPSFTPSFYVQALGRTDGNSTLRPEDVSEVAAHMPHMLTRDLDEVFSFIVKHLVAGLAAELAEGKP
jgi:AcrR family transcriptional regulator